MTAQIETETSSFSLYHDELLPDRLSQASTQLPSGYSRSLRPFGIRHRESGRTYTYQLDPHENRIEITRGDSPAQTLIELSDESFFQLTEDLESAAGLIYGQRVDRVRGNLMDFLQWEPALRWMYRDRPVYDAENVDLRGRNGTILDPTRSFGVDDDPEDMAEFLRVVGFLWIRDVLAADRIEALAHESELLRAEACEGDQESWWGKNEAGESVLCRVLRAGKQPTFRALHGDPQLERFPELCDVPMDHKQGPEDKDGVALLWKQPGVAEGLGDLPWHRDCGMGGHASMCPTAVMSIFLGPNTPEAGEIRFLPGSWKKSFPFAEGGEDTAHLGVAPSARPGDITLHYGDGLHVAPPPTGTSGPFRSCALMGYGRVGGGHHLGKRHYNDVLLGSEDGQVKHMRQIVEES